MHRNTFLETITASVFIFFVIIILYYSFYPFKVTTLNSINVDNARYCRGDWVQVELNFVKHMDIQASITWYIVDGIVYELESPGINRIAGENHLVISKQIPYSILPGKYNLRIESVYQVHPLHKPIVNTWNTPTFEVSEASECSDNPDENLSFPDPVNKPIVEKSSPVITPQTEVVQSTNIITEKKDEPQTLTPEQPSNPIQNLIKNVKGLLN